MRPFNIATNQFCSSYVGLVGVNARDVINGILKIYRSISDYGHGCDLRPGGRFFGRHADRPCARHGDHDGVPGSAEHTRGYTSCLSQSRHARRRRRICGNAFSNFLRNSEVRAYRSAGDLSAPARLFSADDRSLVVAESRRCRFGHRSRVGRC